MVRREYDRGFEALGRRFAEGDCEFYFSYLFGVERGWNVVRLTERVCSIGTDTAAIPDHHAATNGDRPSARGVGDGSTAGSAPVEERERVC